MPLLHVSRLRIRVLESTQAYGERVRTDVSCHLGLWKLSASLYLDPSIFSTKCMSSLLGVFLRQVVIQR
jgi:hypothetical protein